MLDIEYNLSVFNENDFIEKNKLIHKSWVANNKKYNILKYNKEFLSFDQIETIGLFRSIIYTNNTINVFSPPKSININSFIDKYNSDDCFAEEYIEGTMINLFYDNEINQWEISTKSSVSANIHFFKDQPTFAKLFYEICNELNINFDLFSKDCCYSFVMQHKDNCNVVPVSENPRTVDPPMLRLKPFSSAKPPVAPSTLSSVTSNWKPATGSLFSIKI